MLRECFFEYAGISSQIYQLMLCYVSNNNTDFDSGGKFDLQTDALPRNYGSLLYGKNYSSKPLEFEVEIVSIDGAIPYEQMIEIKNWLYGQDGWKTLKLQDGHPEYHLKCIFEPGEDIVDGRGYMGLRCTLHNASPFWYGDERTIIVNHSEFCEHIGTDIIGDEYGIFSIELPDDIVDLDVHPNIYLQDRRYAQREDVGDYEFDGYYQLSTVEPSSVESILDNDDATFDPSKGILSQFAYDADYLPPSSSDANWDATHGQEDIHIDTLYGRLYSSNEYWSTTEHKPTWKLLYSDKYNPAIFITAPPLFRLHKGLNVCTLKDPKFFAKIELKYTPMYRVGAF